MKAALILAAAGKGERMGCKKQFMDLEGQPMFLKSLEPFKKLSSLEQVIICLPVEDKGWVEEELLPPFSLGLNHNLVAGGKTRQETIKKAIDNLDPEIEVVLIHDAARPFVSFDAIERVYKKAAERKAAVLGLPCRDTIKMVDEEQIVVETPLRSRLRAIQTPQGFSKDVLIQAYNEAEEKGLMGTDDATLVEKAGYEVVVLPGEEKNLKVTNREDMQLFKKDEIRTGTGIDIHPLVRGKELVLGGVKVESSVGCEAHSDGDVLIHALMDALLGAAGLPDIGYFFPDSKSEYKDISSLTLLKEVSRKISNKGWKISNIDSTLLLETPRLSTYIPQMKNEIAEALKISVDSIGIKATTAEKMGFIGRGEGIAAQAVATLISK